MTNKPIDRTSLPVLPLREQVLFPGVSTSIGAGRPATLRAIEAALKHDPRLMFVVSQRENVDQVTPAVLHTVGTIARITVTDAGVRVLVECGFPLVALVTPRSVTELGLRENMQVVAWFKASALHVIPGATVLDTPKAPGL